MRARIAFGDRGKPEGLLPLDLATERLRPSGARYAGIRPIPLARIIGSDSRAGDFDREFTPRRPGLRARLREVERAFPDGAYPPIDAVQLGDAYFVVDGHHRVALARRRRMETIDAQVTILRARWHLSGSAGVAELAHAGQEWRFMHESGLAETRPNAAIRFSLPVGYAELLESVQRHGYRLMLDRGRALARAEIAADWFDRVYVPARTELDRASIEGACSGATADDKLLWLEQVRRRLLLDCACATFGDALAGASRRGRG